MVLLWLSVACRDRRCVLYPSIAVALIIVEEVLKSSCFLSWLAACCSTDKKAISETIVDKQNHNVMC